MMIGALSRRQKVYTCGEKSRAKTHTHKLLERKEREKREKEERAEEFFAKKAQKKK